jgi:hypothetical protein
MPVSGSESAILSCRGNKPPYAAKLFVPEHPTDTEHPYVAW